MPARPLVVILLLIALCGCTVQRMQPAKQAFTYATPAATKTQGKAGQPPRMGPQELQAAIMSFADTTNSRCAEASYFIEKMGTPEARLTAARMRVFEMTSNVEIAAGPYPGVALLDMIVVCSLRRIVWEEFWVPHFGPRAEPALEFFREAEEDIWEIAAKVMPQPQMDELRTMIHVWRKKNPRQVSVNYIRFHDFGELGLKPSMRDLTVPGGLFASVEKAAMIAQDMKVAMDRAFYLLSRMQMIMSFQVELAYLELIFQPEADGVADETRRITDISERYAEIAEKLPQRLGDETGKLMREAFANLAANRDETIAQVLTGLTAWQDTAISGVMTRISEERQAAIDQAISGLVLQQNELYTRMDELVGRSGDEFKETLNHAFMLGVGLIAVFFILLSVYRKLIVPAADRGR
jgi:hypothetical protein